MPHAKLLSKNEQDTQKDETLTRGSRKNASNKDAAESAVTLFLLYLLAVTLPCGVSALSQREREASRLLYQRRRTSLSFFFVLPPPVLA